jgi:hypothetical protein
MPRLPERWIHLLDGRRVGAGRKAWTFLVDGIHVQHEDIWIQGSRAGDPGSTLLLHVEPHATIRGLLAALRALPADDDYRIDVSNAA